MSDIRTKPATREYRENWDRVFGRKAKARDKGVRVVAGEWRLPRELADQLRSTTPERKP